MDWQQKVEESHNLLKGVLSEFNPTHIVSMVSGGRDSACSHQVLLDSGVKVDMVVHGYTRCGIEETTDFVKATYGSQNLVIADAGTAYEDYVLRKGFFGVGRGAHDYSFRILKAGPFRMAISREIRQSRRGVRVLLVNGAFAAESANRQKNLKLTRPDPGAPGNLWFNIIHNWTAADRDAYLIARGVPINPVARKLCRSGECMCGTMQTKAERIEAAAAYPKWGAWLKSLEDEVRLKHGWGWGEQRPKPLAALPLLDLPLCNDCMITPSES